MSKIKTDFKGIKSILDLNFIHMYWDKDDNVTERKTTNSVGCFFMTEEDDGRDLGIFLDYKKNAVVIDCKKFELKDCMTIIDIINVQLCTNHNYNIAYGSAEKKDFERYCEECVAKGVWRCGFIEKFDELKDYTRRITIQPMWIGELNKAVIIVDFE